MSREPHHTTPEGLEEAPRATPLDDRRIEEVRPLISPALLQYELPAPAQVQHFVATAREQVSAVLNGTDRRLVVVVGPCSIHDHAAALAYARRLRVLSDELKDDLLVVMRVYFEKPRTTVGWKGYINDPDLDGSFKINKGLRLARELLLAVAEMALPAGTEFLDLLSPQYIADLVTWGAIGARTTESASHRQLASGLSCPVGFKNGTDGGVQVAVDALIACRSPHAFMGMTKMGQVAIFQTSGNEDGHVILRGGAKGPNFDAASLEATCEALRRAGLPERVMVDCSHANSRKDYRRQMEVVTDLAQQLAAGERRLIGVMIESHLKPGRQDLTPGVAPQPEVSITDACIGWDDTEEALRQLAAAVRTRNTVT